MPDTEAGPLTARTDLAESKVRGKGTLGRAMIRALARARERALEPLGLDGPGRGMDRAGVPSQRRFHASAVLSLLRCPAQPDEGLTVKQEIKAIDERDDPQRRELSSAVWRIRRSHATVGGGPSGARLAQGRASSPLVGAFSACPRRRVDEGRDRSCSMKGHNLLLVKVALGREEAQPGHAPALLLSGCCHWLLAASSASSLESPASYSMMAARSS